MMRTMGENSSQLLISLWTVGKKLWVCGTIILTTSKISRMETRKLRVLSKERAAILSLGTFWLWRLLLWKQLKCQKKSNRGWHRLRDQFYTTKFIRNQHSFCIKKSFQRRRNSGWVNKTTFSNKKTNSWRIKLKSEKIVMKNWKWLLKRCKISTKTKRSMWQWSFPKLKISSNQCRKIMNRKQWARNKS